MELDQVRFRDLVKDEVYLRWLKRSQEPHPIAAQPWRVWVQVEQGGRWRRKDFADYAQALKFAAKRVKLGDWDLAIHHKPSVVLPPRVRIGKQAVLWLDLPRNVEIATTHEWCGLCRRPTLFRRFRKHHAFPPNLPADPEVRRCVVCGGSEPFVRPRR